MSKILKHFRAVLQIRRGKRDNSGIIFHIATLKRIRTVSVEPFCQDGCNGGYDICLIEK